MTRRRKPDIINSEDGPTKDFRYKDFFHQGGEPLTDEVEIARIECLVTEVLQPLRDALRKPIYIIATDVNYHGCAVSIHVHSLPASEVRAILRGFMIARYTYTGAGGAVGEYRGFASVGINDDGKLAVD